MSMPGLQFLRDSQLTTTLIYYHTLAGITEMNSHKLQVCLRQSLYDLTLGGGIQA